MIFRRSSTIPTSLRKSPLGNVLPKAELEQLTQLSSMVTIPQGATLIEEGSRGRECFVVVDGNLTARTSSGFEASIGAGEIAGELALLTGRKRAASVVAATDITARVMHPGEFATLMSEAHQFRSRVLESAYARVNAEDVTLPAQFVRQPL